mmetsp:Transcript_75051/g.132618  ORF Transcript_75051/g.132618 Transcript_75051/m.132618 type:complete len:293 (+) Transcript_75051:2474-3352(+)
MVPLSRPKAPGSWPRGLKEVRDVRVDRMCLHDADALRFAPALALGSESVGGSGQTKDSCLSLGNPCGYFTGLGPGSGASTTTVLMLNVWSRKGVSFLRSPPKVDRFSFWMMDSSKRRTSCSMQLSSCCWARELGGRRSSMKCSNAFVSRKARKKGLFSWGWSARNALVRKGSSGLSEMYWRYFRKVLTKKRRNVWQTCPWGKVSLESGFGAAASRSFSPLRSFLPALGGSLGRHTSGSAGIWIESLSTATTMTCKGTSLTSKSSAQAPIRNGTGAFTNPGKGGPEGSSGTLT